MKKFTVLLAALAGALAIGIVPAGAITDGELDGEGHPYVGLMVAKNASGVPLWRCSGTLLSSRVFLTAGHCTEAPAASIEIWFDAGPIPRGNLPTTPGTACAGFTGYPCTGDATGTPHTHPDYDPDRFFVRDLGVVVIDAADAQTRATYGVLPQQDQLDALKTQRGKQDVTFTAVGYGLQKINPVFVEQARVRMVAYPRLIQINVPGFVGDFSMLLSNNASTGGTCFGDSGGPNFLGNSNVVAGVTSFGINGNCAGTGGVYRLDRSWNLTWLENTFGTLY